MLPSVSSSWVWQLIRKCSQVCQYIMGVIIMGMAVENQVCHYHGCHYHGYGSWNTAGNASKCVILGDILECQNNTCSYSAPMYAVLE